MASFGCSTSEPVTADGNESASAGDEAESEFGERAGHADSSALRCSGQSVVVSSPATEWDREETITFECATDAVRVRIDEQTRIISEAVWNRVWSTLDGLDWNRPSECDGSSPVVLSVARGPVNAPAKLCATNESADATEFFATVRAAVAFVD